MPSFKVRPSLIAFIVTYVFGMTMVYAAPPQWGLGQLCYLEKGESFDVYNTALIIEGDGRSRRPPPVGQLLRGTYIPCKFTHIASDVQINIKKNKETDPSLFIEYDPNRINNTPFPSRQYKAEIGTTNRYIPQEIFLDGDVGRRISVFEEAGLSFKDVPLDASGHPINDKHPGVAWPQIGDRDTRVFLRDAQYVVNYKDPLTGETGPRVFYKVDIVKSDKKDLYLNEGPQHAQATGWIDSISTRLTELPADTLKKVKKPEPYCVKKEGAGKTLNQQIDEVAEPLNAIQNDFFSDVKNALKSVENLCLWENKKTPRKSEVAAHLANRYNAYYSVWHKPKSIRGNSPSESQLHAIDSLARTIFGEMRMRSCGTKYMKAVARIALNRAQFISKTKKRSYCPTSLQGKSFETCLHCALGAKGEFSPWLDKDPNYVRMMCIKDSLAREAWSDAVDIATEAILNRDQFELETSSLKNATYFKSLNGTVDSKNPFKKDKAVEIKGVHINGNPLDNRACMVFGKSTQKFN